MSKRITILGAGESGTGAAILAKKHGYDVFVSDLGKIRDNYKTLLNEKGIEFEEDGHTLDRILGSIEIIKSPGIPESSDIIKSIVESRIPVISEIEFASRFTNSKIILITGTNGKTTTTLLTYHLLKSSGLHVGLAGNVGHSLARMVAEDPREIYVVEVSSFQLDGCYDLRADAAILLNITPDHLDRYQNDLKKYIDSKFRVIQNMNEDDPFIYYYDDFNIKAKVESSEVVPRQLPIRVTGSVEFGGFLNNSHLVIRLGLNEYKFDTKTLPLKGEHNAVNMMAAIICAFYFDVTYKDILKGLESFKNAPHRMEKVAEIDGIDFVNDSKATNVDSAFYALGSYPSIIWIAGGKDKGNVYDQVKVLAKEKVKALICLGVNNQKLLDYFQGIVPTIIDTNNIKDAVRKAFYKAKAGDTVLLSPACASFDLFNNYEDRGDQFKREVILLKNEVENKNKEVL